MRRRSGRKCRKVAAWGAFLLGSLLAGSCGGSGPGFRIDNVTLSPNDVPVNPSGSVLLRVGADIFDDRHDVTNAWVQAEDQPIWIDLVRGTDPHWSASLPLTALGGMPVGTYRFDVHADDDAGRAVVLRDAVRLEIRLE